MYLSIADSVQPGRGHDHRLGVAADLGHGVGPEVLDDDFRLLGKVVGVRGDEPSDCPLGLGGLIARVVRDSFLYAPVGLVV